MLSRVAARLSDDWTERYGHPVLVVETFVDPQLYRGTVYQAAGWTQLGTTQGNQRVSRDYYEPHDRPKLLFARELARGACRSLQAERLKPALADVEAATLPRCTESPAQLKSLSAMFREHVPEYRNHKRCIYPVHALLGIMAAAYLADAPRGQKDLEVFAKSLSQAQLKALGVRRASKTGHCSSPDQNTFSRMMSKVNAAGRYRHPHDKNPAPLDDNFQGWAVVPSGKDGGFRFKTIVPGTYPAAKDWMRPPHIHIKVSKRGYEELTTQMYFPGHELNDKDRLLQRKKAEEQKLMIATQDPDKKDTFHYQIVLQKL